MDSHNSVKGNIFIERKALPRHYLCKILSFSLLSKAPVNKYTTDAFDAGGFKWKLSLYPNGDESNNGKGYISIYLEPIETSSLPTGWEINAIVNFFIFNPLHDKYVTIQEPREIRRFHAMRTKWGINKFMDLKTFNDPSNGYLINDTCVFGAEVFVIKSAFGGECLSMMEEPVTYCHSWKVDNFSSLLNQCYYSKSFGCYNWKIHLFPYGDTIAKRSNVSLYLSYAPSSLPQDTKLFVKFTLRIKNQKNKQDIENEADIVFSPSTEPYYGFPKFMSLFKLKDPKEGYLVDDTCIIEAEVILLALILNDH